VDERKLRQVIILAASVLAVSAAIFLWSFGGEGDSLLSLLAFNGLFICGACLICVLMGRGGGTVDSPVAEEDDKASLAQSRLQKYLRGESGDND